jgi:flagellar biosynthesis protein FlhB
MADDSDSASKTEEPTPRKLQQAREKGDVAKTPDLAALLALSGAAAVLAIGGGWLGQNLAAGLTPFIARAGELRLEGGGAVEIVRYAILAGAPLLLTVLAVAALLGAVGNLVQHGFMFTPQKIKPDLKKLSPIAAIKRIFGPDGLMQFVKSVTKIAMVAAVAWIVMRPYGPTLRTLSAMDASAILPLVAEILRKLVFAVAALMLVIAAADYLWQRQRFMKRMRMTKEELKDDYKATEGDPHVKAKRKQIQMMRSRQRMMQAVPSATVVVMNPTHYAVALKYEEGQASAPQCVAKGVDALALRIRAAAENAGVPVIEDPPLARALYAAVEIDEFIPPAHYEAVARIIGFVFQSGRRAAKRQDA